MDDVVDRADGDFVVKQIREQSRDAAIGRVAGQDKSKDELLEPVVGDRQPEEQVIRSSRRVEGGSEGVVSLVLLLVDELAADLVLRGEVGDTATLSEGIHSEVQTLLGRHALCSKGRFWTRGVYNTHGLASGGSRGVC